MNAKLALLISLVSFVPAAWAAMPDEDCVPDGESTTLEFDRPPLIANGMPVDATWTGDQGDPKAMEDDIVSDDPMGDGTPSASGDSASVDVENKGGNLSGPNGDVQNGLGEGDCIEVKMCWTYRYPVSFKTCLGSKSVIGQGVGISGDACTTVVLWKYKTICSTSSESVCPC